MLPILEQFIFNFSQELSSKFEDNDISNEETFLIWSFEHNAFWKPFEQGYTPDIREAGLYGHETTKRILFSANFDKRQAHELAILVYPTPRRPAPLRVFFYL